MQTATTTRLTRARDLLSDTAKTIADPAASSGLSDHQLIELLQQIGDVHRLTESLLISAIGEAVERTDRRGEQPFTTTHGARNIVQLVRGATLCDSSTAKRLETAARRSRREISLSTGELLPGDFPRLGEALRDGAIGLAGYLAATGPLVESRHRLSYDELAEADTTLASYARGTIDANENANPAESMPPMDAHALAAIARLYTQCADPDGAEPSDDIAIGRRGLSIGDARGGLVKISGNLLPDVAGQLVRLMDTILNPRRADGEKHPGGNADAVTPHTNEVILRDDRDDVGGERSGLTGFRAEQRTGPQKRHDALATILSIAARSSEAGIIGGAAPTLVVTMRADDYAAGRGWAHLDGVSIPTSFRSAQQAACTGTITRVLHDDAGRVRAIHTHDRVFNAHQRRAIAARDRACIIPGCDVPAAWCEIHHVIEYAKGGPTHTDNGVLLCWAHHRTLGTNGWHIRMRGGLPEVRGPAWWDRHQHWRPVGRHLSATRLHPPRAG